MDTTTPPSSSPARGDAAGGVSQEIQRAKARQKALAIDANRPAGLTGNWALALSGGGIRSATFSLGVIQGLTRTVPPAVGEAPPGSTNWPLMAHFDFLSTVSGGGYIGGFVSSLFVPGRLTGQTPGPTDPQRNEQAADPATVQLALAALSEEPPGRIRSTAEFNALRPGETALAWLRDNGRYLTPGGAGDLAYGIAVVLRNWFATQYVIGTLILLALSTLQAIRWGLLRATTTPTLGWLAGQEATWLHQATHGGHWIWWSPAWYLVLLPLGLLTLPLGIAYWFSHPARLSRADQAAPATLRPHQGATNLHAPQPPQEARCLSLASVWGAVLALLGLCLAAGLWHLGMGTARPMLVALVGGGGALTGLAVLAYGAVTCHVQREAARQPPPAAKATVTAQRVALTRALTWSLKVVMATVAVAAIDTLAQSVWLALTVQSAAISATTLGATVWLLKKGLDMLGRQGSARDESSWLSRLPLGLLAGLAGTGLWLIAAACWGYLVLSLIWSQPPANPAVFGDLDTLTLHAEIALGTAACALVLAGVVALFPGFLNLSTLQTFYSARIVRTYLGATNHRRFARGSEAKAKDVAEPVAGDNLSLQEVYANPLAPIHLVNVCVNQSVSPGENLIQGDRKGKPLVIAPGGFYLDQDAHPMGLPPREGNELSAPLSFGEWLGVSGAAFSTGLGRGTGLGLSLALGFANVRLGRWWRGLPRSAVKGRPGLFQRLFPTQAYLINEFCGRFYGDHRPYQYLSDGGHFENTAVFELLRTDRQRGIRLIVVTDAGADPDYQFEDLANLIRLVRIDHGLEIRVSAANDDPLLQGVFGTPRQIAQTARTPDGPCAVMLDVVGTTRSAARGVPDGALFSRIVLLKPVIISHVGADVDQYKVTHPSFPQETTVDQFFDEAQWESYRQLGLQVAQRVFQGPPCEARRAAYVQALWAALGSASPHPQRAEAPLG